MRVKIIRVITWVAGIVGVFAITALDSVSNIPFIVASICLAWLLPVTVFNLGYLRDKYDHTF